MELATVSPKPHKELILHMMIARTERGIAHEPIVISQDREGQKGTGEWGIQVQFDLRSWLAGVCTCSKDGDPDELIQGWIQCLVCDTAHHAGCNAGISELLEGNPGVSPGDLDWTCGSCERERNEVLPIDWNPGSDSGDEDQEEVVDIGESVKNGVKNKGKQVQSGKSKRARFSSD